MKTKHRNASRTKRQARTLDGGLIDKVLSNVSKLTPSEIAQVITPVRAAMLHLKRCTATQHDFVWLCTAGQIGMSIERGGVVRGLASHMQAGLDALQAVAARGTTAGEWRSPAMRAAEIDAIDTMLDLHEYQLKQLSYGEFTQANRSAALRVSSTGGQVFYGAQP